MLKRSYGAFKKALSPGLYKLKKNPFDRIHRQIILVEMRERSITIKGQEILTADKVAIRVSLLVYFRVKDPEAAFHNVDSYEERIYEDVQTSARRFLASRTLDAIQSDRNGISEMQSMKPSKNLLPVMASITSTLTSRTLCFQET